MAPCLRLLALLLPLVAVANPILSREVIVKSTNYGNATPSWTSTASWNTSSSSIRILADQDPGEHKGDTLGVTRCYCASPYWGSDNLFGHYYLWDYYNAHSNHHFLLERICRSTAMTRTGVLGSVAYEIMCLRPRKDDHKCMKDAADNKFCYIINGKEKFDKFKYNHQMRGLPLDDPRAMHVSEEKVEERCDKLCHDKVGGLEMLKGIALVHAIHVTPDQDRFHDVDNEWSHVSYYPEIDDMCPGCA